jgi:hypothetical protein
VVASRSAALTRRTISLRPENDIVRGEAASCRVVGEHLAVRVPLLGVHQRK